MDRHDKPRRVFAIWRQTDKHTDEQMDTPVAWSRSRCRERRLNKPRPKHNLGGSAELGAMCFGAMFVFLDIKVVCKCTKFTRLTRELSFIDVVRRPHTPNGHLCFSSRSRPHGEHLSGSRSSWRFVWSPERPLNKQEMCVVSTEAKNSWCGGDRRRQTSGLWRFNAAPCSGVDRCNDMRWQNLRTAAAAVLLASLDSR